MKELTLGEQIAAKGEYKDAAQYQSLKESAERERAGVAQLYEHLKRLHGHDIAIQMMKQKGYNPALLKR